MRSRYTAKKFWLGVLGMCLASLITGALVVWFATPLPTYAARYVWQQWHAPSLALVLDRRDAPLALQIGNDYFGANIIGRASPQYNIVLAARAFRKALAIEPGILWGHYALARIAFAKGDFKTALVEINAELTANPENLRSLYVRGLIYGYRSQPGDLALAESDFTRFVSWAPTEWAGYNDLSWILLKEGKYAQVEALMAQAFVHVTGGTENPWLENGLGAAELALGEDAQAAHAFEAAQTYSAALTSADWYRAYSGDSPASDAAGLAAFRAGIATNLAKARAGAK